MIKNWLPLVLGPELAMARRAGRVEVQVRIELIVEGVAGIAHAGARWIAALNHEFGNHAMECGAVVKRLVVLLLAWWSGRSSPLCPSARPMKLATALGACF